MDDFAYVDNLLSASQTDIGESSNLAQLAQTYSYTFSDKRFDDYVCALSVIAQAAIDNSKRTFDINIANEIKRIKNEMDIKTNKYPKFWLIIKKNFNKNNINSLLHCPMDYLYDLKFDNVRQTTSTLPMDYFFQKYNLDIDRRTSKKVEELIAKYSLDLYNYNVDNSDDYILIRSDFNDLINDIRQINISKNYLGLMSWLVDRCFVVSPALKQNKANITTSLNKNKSLLLSVLYQVNKQNLFKVLSKNIINS